MQGYLLNPNTLLNICDQSRGVALQIQPDIYIYILRVDISAFIFAVWARAHTQGEVSQIPLRAAQRMTPGYKTVYSTCLIDVPRAARGHLTPGETAIFRNVNFGS